jgi:phosphoglycerate dehydrogenase-like enzyme
LECKAGLSKPLFLAKNMKRRVHNILGSELNDKTSLVMGPGAVGTEVSKRATAFGIRAFGIRVIAITKLVFKETTQSSRLVLEPQLTVAAL